MAFPDTDLPRTEMPLDLAYRVLGQVLVDLGDDGAPEPPWQGRP